MYKIESIEKIAKDLQNGDDSSLRATYANEIEKVLTASARGEIGFGGFIQDIRTLLKGMEMLANKNWTEFD